MNIFYAPPAQITGEMIELTGQEARHAGKVLRYSQGDSITVVDGTGGWYEGNIQQVLSNTIQIKIEKRAHKEPPRMELVVTMGILKKRDRMEFAVEKAVELGATGIILFRSENTVKETVRMDRLQNTVLSAMKQSLRAYLPKVEILDSLEKVVQSYPDHKLLAAHEKNEGKPGVPKKYQSYEKLLLLTGPEGGFADEEIALLKDYGTAIISLGSFRLRTETAVIVFLSQFNP